MGKEYYNGEKEEFIGKMESIIKDNDLAQFQWEMMSGLRNKMNEAIVNGSGFFMLDESGLHHIDRREVLKDN